MNEYPDLSLFLQNLWLRENDIGLKAIEGKGGYSNGKYYPYRTANGNIDVGPGFDMEKQTPEFRKRAAEGFTKEELDNMVLDIARNELPYFRRRIIREGGDPDKVTDAIYNGLLDMYWQLNNGLYGYDKFWRAVANMDYEGMRNESATYYPPKNGKIPKGAIVKDGKILDTGRWDFRKTNYFKDPEILNNIVNNAAVQTSPIMEPVFNRSIYVEQPDVIRDYKPVIFPSDTRMDVRKGMQDKIDFNNFMDSIRIQNNLQTYNPPIQFNNGEATESNQYDKGGSLKFPQWDNLSVKEKADIMKVAISNGITNLSDIKQQYNEFAEGGDTNPPIKTTGGAGYFPEQPPFIKELNIPRSMEEARLRLYNQVSPAWGFTDDTMESAMQTLLYNKGKWPKEEAIIRDPYVDGVWAEYLQIPEDKRRSKYKLEHSSYTPTQGSVASEYYKIPIDGETENILVSEGMKLPLGKNKLSTTLEGYNHGEHTVGNGVDPIKGQYVSYYDKWDLNPVISRYSDWSLKNKDNILAKLLNRNNGEDSSFGIGKPLRFYDRIYLDDYYGVNSAPGIDTYYGGYLPEVTVDNFGPYSTVTAGNFTEYGVENRRAKGGSIRIKPSHRGRLTKLKKRTGKTESELYNDGNPAHRKMVVFARNARKWHDLGGNLFDIGGPTEEDVERLFWANKMDAAKAALEQVKKNKPKKAPTPIIDKQLPELLVFPERSQGEITPVTGNALNRAINNYTGELKYDLANGRVPGGKYILPAAVLGAAGLSSLASLPAIGEAYYAAGLSPLVMEGLAAPYAAHGLDNLIHGNADWQTALEIAPLAGYAKPVWDTGKAVYNAGKRLVSDAYNWRPIVPSDPNRYYRMVGSAGNPIEDAIESGVIRGPGQSAKVKEALRQSLKKKNGKVTLVPKTHDYPMFSKGNTWNGSTSMVSKEKPIVIRSKADTGPIKWEESNIDFDHKGHPGIFRPSYNGDPNASPTTYFEYWEPRKFGYVKREFPAPQITAENDIVASLNTEVNSKLPPAIKAVKAMKAADNDVKAMNVYHDANVAAYNEATGSSVKSIPFRTDASGRRIRVLPDNDFNAAYLEVSGKSNAPSSVEHVGGFYKFGDDTVYLRQIGSPSNAYHEFLHSNNYGITNPEVTKWRIDQLVDPEKIKNLSPKSKSYYLSEAEFPVHLRQQGESWGINVGDPFPGEEAFDELIKKNGIFGATSYAKRDTPEAKRLLWKGLNGTLFNWGIPASILTTATLYNQKALGGNLYPNGGPINPFVQKAIKYFMDRGFTDYQAAGLVGNLMRESSMDPNAVNRWSDAFGLAQWLGERKAALFAMYGPKPTFEQQLDFIWHELNTTHKNGLKYLLASRNAEEAARNAMGYYEFSAGPEGAIAAMNKHKQNGQASMDKGIAFANQFYGYYNPKPVVAEVPVEPSSRRQFTFGINPVDNTYVEKPRYYDIPMSTPVNEQYSAEALARQQASDNINTLTAILGMMDTRSQNPLNDVLQYLT